MNMNELSAQLAALPPAKRVKFLRQKLLKQNQHCFCEDGIVRSGTLKSIESERMNIGPKIAQRLVHKFHLEGILCEPELFLEQENACIISTDFSKKELTGDSMSYLEEIRQKITQLTPIIINTDEYAPSIPRQTTLLTQELRKDELKQLNNTLCYIKGDKSSLYYLTYLNKEELSAYFNNKRISLSTNLFDFCALYRVEIIYFRNTKENTPNA